MLHPPPIICIHCTLLCACCAGVLRICMIRNAASAGLLTGSRTDHGGAAVFLGHVCCRMSRYSCPCPVAHVLVLALIPVVSTLVPVVSALIPVMSALVPIMSCSSYCYHHSQGSEWLVVQHSVSCVLSSLCLRVSLLVIGVPVFVFWSLCSLSWISFLMPIAWKLAPHPLSSSTSSSTLSHLICLQHCNCNVTGGIHLTPFC